MKKNLTFLIVISLFSLTALGFFLRPKSTLTMGVDPIVLNDKGELTWDGSLPGILRSQLKEQGINLKFKAFPRDQAKKSPFELMEQDPKVDFVMIANTGIKPSGTSLAKYASLGTITQTPLYFYEKQSSIMSSTRFLSDLDGKKIAFFSWKHKPEDFDFYRFMWEFGADKPIQIHPFSSEAVIKLLLDVSMSVKNPVQLSNPFPEQEVTTAMDWDLLLTPNLPFGGEGMTGVDFSVPNALFEGELKLVDFSDLDALVLRHPALKLINIPAGLLFQRFKIPDKNIKVVAYEESVVARKNIDTGLATSLAEALQKTFSRRTVFNKRGSYPYFSDYEIFEPNEDVSAFYKNGKPFLSHYFPLRYAILLQNLFLFLLPIMTLAIPLSKLVPYGYRQFVNKKFQSWYKRLKQIEDDFERSSPRSIENLKIQIEAIDTELKKFKFRFRHADHVQEIYIVREHCDLIKNKILSKTQGAT